MIIILFLLFNLFIRVNKVDIIELWIWFWRFERIGVKLLILLKNMMVGFILKVCMKISINIVNGCEI